MTRFTRFKLLRALWARARSLMAWLAYPKSQEARRAAERWTRIQIAERHLRDGVVRGMGDPDSYTRPPSGDTAMAARALQQAQYERQWESQREQQQRWQEMQRNGAGRRR